MNTANIPSTSRYCNTMFCPVEPSREDCCNSGCNPCIFDVYETQLKKYQNWLINKDNISETKNAISQLEYTGFIVLDNRIIDECHNLLVFKRAIGSDSSVWWKPGQHFLCKYTREDNTCTRAYTPLRFLDEFSNYDFKIIVKNYFNNSVASHLCSLKVGSQVLWRGPYGSYEYEVNKSKRIIMLAQGTGVVPFYSIINKVVKNEDDFTSLVLFYCCKNCILFRNELFNLQSYWNFTYKVYVHDDLCINMKKYNEPIINCRLTFHDINIYKPFTSDDQILICGSIEFMSHYKSLFLSEKVDNIFIF